MNLYRIIHPDDPLYLPPNTQSYADCGEVCPKGIPWRCTREPEHESLEGENGDHASHSDLARVLSGDLDTKKLPDMVARWDNG